MDARPELSSKDSPNVEQPYSEGNTLKLYTEVGRVGEVRSQSQQNLCTTNSICTQSGWHHLHCFSYHYPRTSHSKQAKYVAKML